MQSTTIAQLGPKELHDSSTTQQLPLGTLVYSRDGRGFRYCQNGGVLLVVGNQIQAAVQNTAFQNLTPSDTAIGAQSVTLTPGSTTGVANLFQDGVLQVDTTPGIGGMYSVANHPAISSATAFTLNLYSDDKIRVAITNANSKVGLIQNAYKNLVQSPTTATGVIVGVCIFPIPASTTAIPQYGFVQTHGLANVLVAGSPGVGIGVGYSATAGAAAVLGATLFQTGGMMVTGQGGLCQAVYLTID